MLSMKGDARLAVRTATPCVWWWPRSVKSWLRRQKQPGLFVRSDCTAKVADLGAWRAAQADCRYPCGCWALVSQPRKVIADQLDVITAWPPARASPAMRC